MENFIANRTEITNLNLSENSGLIGLQCIGKHKMSSLNLDSPASIRVLELKDNWRLNQID